jgi:succinate dehydrogenase / fumarate reductase flavoprotein subunit
MKRVLVIGGGLAGLRAAIAAAENGALVTLVSKVHPLSSHSIAATGGINVALGGEDSWESHVEDTLQASGGLADRDAVEKICREAVEELQILERWGVPFDRDSSGRLGAKPLGGSSQARTVFAGSHTGKAVLQALWQKAMSVGVCILEDCFLLELVISGETCCGAVLLDLKEGKIIAHSAGAVLLATGGLGQVYSPTSNATICTGDGVAAALHAGASLLDMEMTQFYPTCFPDRGICVTEEARTKGAVLVNDRQERFMLRYDRALLDLANRDVLCRAMFAEISTGRQIFLDCAAVPREELEGSLRDLSELSRMLANVDVSRQQLPVVPAMHYHMGGIGTDLEGETTIPGLLSAGECACVSVHGANRIGGNSLLETLVMGHTSGKTSARIACESDRDVVRRRAVELGDHIQDLRCRVGDPRALPQLRRRLGRVMSEKVGIVREAAELRMAADMIEDLQEEASACAPCDSSEVFNKAIRQWFELANLVALAHVIAASAVARCESRGAHYRADFPRMGTVAEHLRLKQGHNGKLVVDFVPVRESRRAVA